IIIRTSKRKVGASGKHSTGRHGKARRRASAAVNAARERKRERYEGVRRSTHPVMHFSCGVSSAHCSSNHDHEANRGSGLAADEDERLRLIKFVHSASGGNVNKTNEPNSRRL